MAISFDGPNKLVILSLGTVTLSVPDLWGRWVDWVLTGDNSKYLPAMSSVGGDDIDPGAGTKIPPYVFFLNGWRLRPQEASHTLAVADGILLVSGGGDPFVNTLSPYVVRINYQQPVQAIAFATGGGGGTADWTSTERAQIRHRLGMDGSTDLPGTAPSLATFDKQQEILTAVENISISSGALAVSASGFTLYSGVVASGSYLDVRTQNGVYHTITDSAGNLDIEYEFDIGASAEPSAAHIYADLTGGNDALTVYAYNYQLAAFEQIGIRQGDNNSNLDTNDYTLLRAHVGDGADIGKVRIRYTGTGLTSATFRVDHMILEYAVVSRRTGFVGRVVSATGNTVVLGSEASDVNNYYWPSLVSITSGVGRYQHSRVESYDGASRTLTIVTPWKTIPDSSSTVELLPWGSVRVTDIDEPALTDLASAIGAAKIDALYTLQGLNPASPLINTESTRQAGYIVQSITDTGTTVTVQRV